MSSGGLFSKKLQDSYQKLVITDDDVGMSSNVMTPLGTSNANAHNSSGLHFGQDNQMNAFGCKVVARNDNTKFFGLESAHDDVNGHGQSMLSFYSSDSASDNGVSLVSMPLMIDTTQNSQGKASKGQIIFGSAPVLTSNISAGEHGKLWGDSAYYPTISSSGLESGNVLFNMGYKGETGGNSNYWSFDRVKIGDFGISNAEYITPSFDATGVAVSAFNGISAVGETDLNGGLVLGAQGTEKLSIKSATQTYIQGDLELWLFDSNKLFLEAYDDAGAASININATQNKGSDNQNPQINIATLGVETRDGSTAKPKVGMAYDLTGGTTTTEVAGTEVVTIGTGTGRIEFGSPVNQLLDINMWKTVFGQGYIVLKDKDEAGTDARARHTTDIGAQETSLYSQVEATVHTLGYQTGIDDLDYKIDSVCMNSATNPGARVTHYKPLTTDPGNSATLYQSYHYTWKGATNYYDIISYQNSATVRYIRYMKLNDNSTVAYTPLTIDSNAGAPNTLPA